MQTLICAGFAGIIVLVLPAAGAEVTFLGQDVLNTLLLPAILFNGAGLSTAPSRRARGLGHHALADLSA